MSFSHFNYFIFFYYYATVPWKKKKQIPETLVHVYKIFLPILIWSVRHIHTRHIEKESYKKFLIYDIMSSIFDSQFFYIYFFGVLFSVKRDFCEFKKERNESIKKECRRKKTSHVFSSLSISYCNSNCYDTVKLTRDEKLHRQACSFYALMLHLSWQYSPHFIFSLQY